MSLKGLLDRMQRYGRGMRRFAEKHGVTEALAPNRDGHSWNDHGKIGDLMLTNYTEGWLAKI